MFIGAALVVFVAFIFSMLKISEAQDTEAALDKCREDVTRRAKYPGGVSFPEDIDIQAADSITESPRTYHAFGHVDFPNGFGTPVREFYSCNIVVDLGDIQDSTVRCQGSAALIALDHCCAFAANVGKLSSFPLSLTLKGTHTMSSPSPYSDNSQPAGQPAAGQPASEQPQKKKGGCLKWGAIIIGVLIIIAIIANMGGSDDKTSESSTDQTTQQGTVEAAPEEEAQEINADDDARDEHDNQPEERSEDQDVPREFKNALKSAKVYSDTMHMSKQGLYDQLSSEYGEQFSPEAAQYAIDNLEADYHDNALQTARDYEETMSMSPNAIYDQLVSEYGEKFTAEEAQYAVDNL